MHPSEALTKIRDIVAQVPNGDREELFEDLQAYVDDNVIDSFEDEDNDEFDFDAEEDDSIDLTDFDDDE